MTKTEQNAYNRGYAAGKRRKARDVTRERQERERKAFLDRVFLAVLPAAMTAQGWKFGEKPINTGSDRIKLARHWAREAANKRFQLHHGDD